MKLFSGNNQMVLMHKDIEVLSGIYDASRHGFRKISKVFSADHAPAGTMHGTSVDRDALNSWLFWRGIPDYRRGLERLKKRLDITDEKELLEEEYALSVSDHYWLRPIKELKRYEDLSFFRREFDEAGFADAVFRSGTFKPKESAKHTPNNTLCGYQRKAWIRRNGTLCLYKGGSGFHQEECINEWLASRIAEGNGIN